MARTRWTSRTSGPWPARSIRSGIPWLSAFTSQKRTCQDPGRSSARPSRSGAIGVGRLRSRRQRRAEGSRTSERLLDNGPYDVRVLPPLHLSRAWRAPQAAAVAACRPYAASAVPILPDNPSLGARAGGFRFSLFRAEDPHAPLAAEHARKRLRSKGELHLSPGPIDTSCRPRSILDQWL